MLMEPNCSKRRCKWYVGVIQPDGTEMTETNFCGAFPNGILHEIAYGNNEHERTMDGQAKPYVYEEDLDWENHWDNLPQDDCALFQKINQEGKARQAALMSRKQENEDSAAETLWELAWDLIRSDQWKKAEFVAKQLVALRPDHPASHNTLGIAYMGVDDLERAKQCVIKSIELDGSDVRGLLLVSHICSRRGEFEEQLSWARRAVKADPQNPNLHMAIAEACNNLGDRAGEEGALLKVIEIDPKNTDAHRHLADLYLSLQRYNDACDRLWTAVQVRPDDASLWTVLGHVMCEMQDYKNASGAFQKALELKPDSSLHTNNLGFAYLAMGKFDDAIPFLTKAVQLNPDNILAHLNLTNALYQAKRYAECVEASKAALRNDPEMEKGVTNFGLNVNSNIGLGYANQGHYEEAEKYFRRNLRLLAPSYYNLGLTLQKQGRDEDALVYLQRAVELEPNDAGFLDVLGDTYKKLGRLEEARNMLEKAIAADKTHAQAHYDLGTVFLKMDNQQDEALKSFERCIEHDRNHSVAYYDIACIYALRGKKDLALQYLEESLRKGFSNRSHIESDKDMDNLRNDEGFLRIIDKYLPNNKNDGAEHASKPSAHHSVMDENAGAIKEHQNADTGQGSDMH